MVILTLSDSNHRFSDRDLLMRYHWGLGVGHLHAHCPESTTNRCSSFPDEQRDIEDDQNTGREPDNVSEHASNIDGACSDAYNSDNSEWDLDNRDFEGWETDSGDDIDCQSEHGSESDEEM
jgi:hypothetical protein